MHSDSVHVVLLSGGSGTRLWPLSNAARSKQFLKVLRDDEGKPESMVQRTVRMVREQCPEARITVATSAAQVDAIQYQLSGEYELSLEPERRDTAPAIMLAAAHVAWSQGAADDATVVVMPIDTFAEPAYYQRVRGLDEAVRSRVADLVLLGVAPTSPSSKFGYIVPTNVADGADVRGPLPVERFVEKPTHELAEDLISKGALWNCGVFAFRLGYLLDIVRQYSDASSYEELRDGYGELPKNSFDYEVVEKAPSVAVIRYTGAWKDLGTWGALCEELDELTAGDAWLDGETVSDVHVVNECAIPVVVAGIEHAVVVATSDGILVAGKSADARVRDLVNQAALSAPMCERKQWGTYRVLDGADSSRGGSEAQTRELEVCAGERIQGVQDVHHATSWTVTSGCGEVTIDGAVQTLSAGDVVRIGPGVAFALQTSCGMRIIEVRCDVSGDE